MILIVAGGLSMEYLDRVDEEDDGQAVESDLDDVDSEDEEQSNDHTEDKKDDFEEGMSILVFYAHLDPRFQPPTNKLAPKSIFAADKKRIGVSKIISY